MRPLLVVLLFAVVFVLVTTNSMPAVVASHFIAGGTANGFMPRGTYLQITLVLLISPPLLIALLSSITSVLPVRFINLPNREYWLAPERQTNTLAYLRRRGTRFGIILVLFLCYVHWLVVLANAQNPPLFPERLFFVGMAVFLVSLVFWLWGFIAHFRRLP